jgi:hypothetical protein
LPAAKNRPIDRLPGLIYPSARRRWPPCGKQRQDYDAYSAFRFREHNGVRLAGDNRIEIGVGHASVEMMRRQAWPLFAAKRAKIQRRCARSLLSLRAIKSSDQ